MGCHVIHGDNADLLTGFISVEASVGSCALTNIEISLLCMWIWSSLCLWMPWPMRCHVIHGDNADLQTGFIYVEASVCSYAHSYVNDLSMLIVLAMASVCSCAHSYINDHSMLIVLAMASVCSCALTKIGMFLLYMWIWSSLWLWMPWPHEVPCHPRWQCWSPNWI